MKSISEIKQAAAVRKQKNIKSIIDFNALYGLISRIAGEAYADKFLFKQKAQSGGNDSYTVYDEDGKIVIEATSGVAAASAFRWYLENRCDSYVGPLTRRLNFPAVPPAVGEPYSSQSVCLYRYFLNYCTYGYTLVFWNWEKWEQLIDWMMLAGYNLVLNPLGNENVWMQVLARLGYTSEQSRRFICSPTVYPWQCMMNITGWAGAAPESWYKKRLELAKKINERLFSFGAAVVLPGWSGMVPSDFKEHYPDSSPVGQGLWCNMPRPGILLPDDPMFDKVAECYYCTQKEILGDNFYYFSTDPFHEGGDSSSVKLGEYAVKCYKAMRYACDTPVWFLQGWQDNPIREMLRALEPEDVLIGNLRATYRCDGGDNFAGYPFLYCCVNNFGGQRTTRGNMNKMLTEAFETVVSPEHTAVGIGMIPEGIEMDEILFDIFADLAVCERPLNPDEWLKERLKIRYGLCGEYTFAAFKLLRDEIYLTDSECVPMDSGLCTRPALRVSGVTVCPDYQFVYDSADIEKVFRLLMKDYAVMPKSETYELDILDIARQVLAYRAWGPVEEIGAAFEKSNETELEANAAELMRIYSLQENLLCCNSHTMLGPWLKAARESGDTAAEKAYFEFLARTVITLWGDRDGADELRDYAARDWSGMLEDFYRPRWEAYINILRRSLVTGNPPQEYNRYDAEYFFTNLSKTYPVKPYGDLTKALNEILDYINGEH